MITDASNGQFTVGIIGGGVAGATAALKMASLGINTLLFEAGDTLVNGPPICHLHAGGNLYRDISLQQCICLLEQSVATVRAFSQSINCRPTVIAIPATDIAEPSQMLERLHVLREYYRAMVNQEVANNVLGDPEDYFSLYYQADLVRLAQCPLPEMPSNSAQWMVPIAKSIISSNGVDKFKYPIVLVQEYGLSVFRLAAIAELGLAKATNCELLFGHQVINVAQNQAGWTVQTQDSAHTSCKYQVDFLINAGGFRSGLLDDMANLPRVRFLEYKAAYLANWSSQQGIWPEIIVHGERGTPTGMAQFTPYPQGYVQLHGMTEDITLFDGGRVTNTGTSAQPLLPRFLLDKIEKGWTWSEVQDRTQKAITHFSHWLPEFSSAITAGKPLSGVQQIPGNDPHLRAADASFEGERYARIELVKASSGLHAVDQILDYCQQRGWVSLPLHWRLPELELTRNLDKDAVTEKAILITRQRGYPDALALPYPK